MTRQNFSIDENVLKATKPVRLWQAERGIIDIAKETLAVSVKLDTGERGYVFHGQGKLTIDAIAETEEGAIGKSIERNLDQPFLMLGDSSEVQGALSKTTEKDFERPREPEIGYANQQQFIAEAERFCDQFSEFLEGRRHRHGDLHRDGGKIFAFRNEIDEFDILVAKGSKLVYKALDNVYVSDRDNVVLKRSPGEVVVSRSGRSVLIKKGSLCVHRER